MRLDNQEESTNVEDRRGGGAVKTGGISILGLVVAFVAWKFFGADPQQAYQVTKQVTTQQQPATAPLKNQTAEQAASKTFVSKVLRSTEEVWTPIFQQHNMTYTPPKLVMYTVATNTACGQGQLAMGPFYCPTDKSVYLDTDFFKQMQTQMGMEGGDFAYAYVIAHEVGHHVQTLLGISSQVSKVRAQSSKAESNALSVRQELQADCYAGIWAKQNNEQKQFLQQGDVERAMDAAEKIGDDYLQKRATGQVVPDSFTHGTSQQRMTWFNKGLQSGKLESCDTFSGSV